ncbi:TonB-dependent receptor [Methylosinus sp. PW1]|uniref:TonB-dependent receptor n=1 Tax=Methylosinus sp. PW1 TaxID=107636 RepID=UPI0009FD3349
MIFNFGTSHEYNNNTTGVFSNSLPLYANGTLGTTYAQTVWNRLRKPILTLDPFKPYYTHLGTLDERQYSLSNEFNIQIGENTLTSISAWGEFVLHPRNSMGNQELEISDDHVNVWTDQYSQEFRLSSPKEQTLEWSVGLYGLYEKIFSYRETIYGSDAAQWYSASPSTDPALMAGFRQHADGKSTTFNIAGFGQATYHVDDQLALTLGLRDSYEVKEGSNFAWVEAGSAKYSLTQVYNAVKGASGTGYFDTGGQSVSRNMVTGMLNPSYKLDDNILLYGLVGRGEKAPAVNTSAQAIWSGTTFLGWQPLLTEAETSWDYEIGAKTNWLDGKLIATLNLYWNDIYNFQANMVNSSITDSTGQPIRQTYLGNVPHVRLRGVEGVGRWSPLERLWLTFNGAYTDARYVDFPNAPVPDDWNWGKTAPLYLSLSNTRFTNLPKWTFNIGADYSHPLGRIFSDFGPWADQPLTAFGYVNLAWSDKYQLTNPWSVFQYWQPAYSIVNAGLGLRTADERYSLQLWAKNLFDTRYIPAQPTGGGWTAGTPTAPASYQLQDHPRYFGGTLRVTLY